MHWINLLGVALEERKSHFNNLISCEEVDAGARSREFLAALARDRLGMIFENLLKENMMGSYESWRSKINVTETL